jgi:Na+/H+ antiporter NhaD/arsenite permease-like protein
MTSLALLLGLPGALASEPLDSSALADHLAIPWVAPFVILLLSIAVLPMVAHHWWESNLHKLIVATVLALPVLGGLLWLDFFGPTGSLALGAIGHAVHEYVSFIVLLGALYTIAGGIYLRGDLCATPLINSTFLLIGALLSNLIGTTGASMLLIRPVLKTNHQRSHAWHVPIFFIFLVSNIGGALTPIGDPPLFLGYLRGVPFEWPLLHLWPLWLTVLGIVLVSFFLLDTWYYRHEPTKRLEVDRAEIEPLRLDGAFNLLLLVGVVGAVLFLSPVHGSHDARNYFLREIAMVLLAALSMALTPRRIRQANVFGFGPILEVAALFLGIFITMIPATSLLGAHGAALGLDKAWHYFWATGILSTFLDNAPTYVTFGALACGHVGTAICPDPDHLGALIHGAGAPLLVAISAGSVFMGACSYIGNGPNFMVKAIADEAGYRMPGFFAYCGWAAVFLLPAFLVVTFLFLL